jgi:hypothetical protein
MLDRRRSCTVSDSAPRRSVHPSATVVFVGGVDRVVRGPSPFAAGCAKAFAC